MAIQQEIKCSHCGSTRITLDMEGWCLDCRTNSFQRMALNEVSVEAQLATANRKLEVAMLALQEVQLSEEGKLDRVATALEIARAAIKTITEMGD